MNLTSDFLHEKKEGPILFLELLQKFDGEVKHSRYAAEVTRNMYGLQSAPRRIADELRLHLLNTGYMVVSEDRNVYYCTTPVDCILLEVTMNDFTAAKSHLKL